MNSRRMLFGMKSIIILFLISGTLSAQWKKFDFNFGADVASMEIRNNEMYVGTYGKGVFYSPDKGLSWTNISGDMSNLNVQAIKLAGDYIFVGTESNIFYTSDNGSSWSKIKNGLIKNIRAFLVLDSMILSGAELGVYYTTNWGINWDAANQGLQKGSAINAFAKNGKYIYTGANTGLYYSWDNGARWVGVNGSIINRNITALAPIDSNVIVGTADGIFYHNNETTGNQRIVYGLKSTAIFDLYSHSKFILAATYHGGVFISTNKGQVWKDVNYNIPSENSYCFAGTGSTIYVGIDSSIYFRDITDLLSNLPPSIYQIPDQDVPATKPIKINIVVDDEKPDNLQFSFSSSKPEIIADTGISVTSKGTNRILTINPTPGKYGSLVIKATISDGLFSSSTTFSVLVQNPNSMDESIEPATINLFETSFDPIQSIISVKFNLIISEQVIVKIFDLMGRKISAIADELMTPGLHELNFETSLMNDGIFFINIHAGLFERTKKVMIYR
ncbi:MAG: BNR/Asp-box repeat protein [Ignavibacteria bacterium]|nr:BNR/Asp-box repeat protein [Ignavibacteria bacterium]